MLWKGVTCYRLSFVVVSVVRPLRDDNAGSIESTTSSMNATLVVAKMLEKATGKTQTSWKLARKDAYDE